MHLRSGPPTARVPAPAAIARVRRTPVCIHMCLNVRDEQEPQFQRAPRACRVMPSPACSDAAHVCQAVAGTSASVIVGAARHRVPPTAEAGQSVRLHGHGTPAPCHAGACPYGGTPRHALARPGTAVKTLTAPGTLRPRRARLGHDARFQSASHCSLLRWAGKGQAQNVSVCSAKGSKQNVRWKVTGPSTGPSLCAMYSTM